MTAGTSELTAGLGPTTAVLLFCHNRPPYLARTLSSLLVAKRNSPEDIALIVSQDGQDPDVCRVIRSFQFAISHVCRFDFLAQPGTPDPANVYRRIAAHYGWGLSQVFDELGFDRAIIVEDDFAFAPDFFSYFCSLAPLLDSDPTLLCISAWNSHGRKSLVGDPTAVYRTDLFPGLGWMMTRARWQTLKPWADIYWDDWLAHPERSGGLTSIYPEMCRVYTFGRVGASGGQFFDQHLAPIELCRKVVDWRSRDLTHIATPDAYDEWLVAQMGKTKIARHWTAAPQDNDDPSACLLWYRVDERDSALKYFGLMDDNKWGRARASYQGILIFRQDRRRVFLAPIDKIQELSLSVDQESL